MAQATSVNIAQRPQSARRRAPLWEGGAFIYGLCSREGVYVVLEARLKTTTYSVRRTFYCFVVLNKETRLLATDSDNRTVDHSIKPFNGTACVKCSRPICLQQTALSTEVERIENNRDDKHRKKFNSHWYSTQLARDK